MKSRSAFSLIEILGVLALVSLLAVLSVPAINAGLRGASLRSTGIKLVDELNYARVAAVSRSLPVEMRFYKVPTSSSPAAEHKVRAYQLFTSNEKGDKTPLGKVHYLPPGVYISEGENESPAIAGRDLEDPDRELPGHGLVYRYISISFKPDGMTNLRQGKNYLTLLPVSESSLKTGSNFYAIQIDPINASVRSFLP